MRVVGLVTPTSEELDCERPEGCMWKLWPEDWEVEWVCVLARLDSTEGKGSRSVVEGGGGVRARARGEAL